MPLGATECARTGLGIPECSCPECTARIVKRCAPEPVRSDPVYRLATRRVTPAPKHTSARQSTPVHSQLGELIPFPPRGSSRGTGDGSGLISVVLAHRHGLTRAAIGALLTAQREITVAGVAADGEAALALAQRARPDIVLLDIELSGVEPVEATRRLLADPATDGVRVVILASAGDADRIIEALRVGAAAVVSENTAPEELVRALRVVARGEQPLLGSGVAGLVLTEV
jgi:CheY-like chemotaxis protein